MDGDPTKDIKAEIIKESSELLHQRLDQHLSGGYSGDSKPCVCRGANENCRFCYGRGFVPAGAPGSRAASPTPITGRGRSEKALRPPKPASAPRILQTCPYCTVSVRKLSRHLTKCPSNPTKRKMVPVSQPKPLLGVPSEEKKPSSNQSPDSRAATPANKTPPLVCCPKCGASVKQKKLSSHLLSRCPRRERSWQSSSLLQARSLESRHALSASAKSGKRQNKGRKKSTGWSPFVQGGLPGLGKHH